MPEKIIFYHRGHRGAQRFLFVRSTNQ